MLPLQVMGPRRIEPHLCDRRRVALAGKKKEVDRLVGVVLVFVGAVDHQDGNLVRGDPHRLRGQLLVGFRQSVDHPLLRATMIRFGSIIRCRRRTHMNRAANTSSRCRGERAPTARLRK